MHQPRLGFRILTLALALAWVLGWLVWSFDIDIAIAHISRAVCFCVSASAVNFSNMRIIFMVFSVLVVTPHQHDSYLGVSRQDGGNVHTVSTLVNPWVVRTLTATTCPLLTIKHTGGASAG